ncbi:MAG: hypothetical protein Edafosvirus5_7 [Edafosvirus sp.]|uniref:Uncharacterized protein n=1 Tax=Edafosvirus sp. TaxID=2487765 RepID=A0A3G4ZXE8_9VIRU|nr:MAG: hypothetical protein Edafosvirus5_7 [Edafosvirus sp.]
MGVIMCCCSTQNNGEIFIRTDIHEKNYHDHTVESKKYTFHYDTIDTIKSKFVVYSSVKLHDDIELDSQRIPSCFVYKVMIYHPLSGDFILFNDDNEIAYVLQNVKDSYARILRTIDMSSPFNEAISLVFNKSPKIKLTDYKSMDGLEE